MREGPLRRSTWSRQSPANRGQPIGYCVGGTLLAIDLAYLAAKAGRRIKSVTLFTAQVDFTHAGDLKVFAARGADRRW